MKLISGTAHPELAQNISKYLNVPLCDVMVKAFPDGETFVKINENIRGQDVFIIQPTCPPTNSNLMELLITVDAAKRASAKRITAVIPFFGYARQDRKDQPRVPITAKLVANLLDAAGVNRVLTMLIGYLKNRGIDNLTVVSPDVGGLKMSDAYAQALDAPLAIVGKRRISATEVEALNLIGEVDGKDVMLVDDMTETAGTLCSAAQLLKENGAGKIYAGVSHGVLGEIGLERLKESCIEELITTDSTPMAKGEKVTAVSVASLLGEGIRRIENDESVTSLFDIVNK